jgi:hypothetical protein
VLGAAAIPPTTPAAWPVPHVHCIEPSPPTFKLLNQVRDKFTQAGAAAVCFQAPMTLIMHWLNVRG